MKEYYVALKMRHKGYFVKRDKVSNHVVKGHKGKYFTFF